MLPAYLLKNEAYLRMLDPDNHSVRYVQKTWQPYFEGDRDFAELVSRCPETISRAYLRQLSEQAHVDPTRARALFLAVMVWGYGTAGRGPWRTRQMMDDLDSRQEEEHTRGPIVLGLTLEHVRCGRLRTAYETLIVRWCGPAFVTKFLYFAGLGSDATPLPLILDSRVARGLAKMAGDQTFSLSSLARLGTNGAVGWYPQGYVQYVHLVNFWADSLECRADAIEMLLFGMPGVEGDQG